MNFGKTCRMIWIDAFLTLNKAPPLRRKHLCAEFGISIAQAAVDFRDFMALFPWRMTYDKTAKGYVVKGRRAFKEDDHNVILDACMTVSSVAKMLGDRA